LFCGGGGPVPHLQAASDLPFADSKPDKGEFSLFAFAFCLVDFNVVHCEALSYPRFPQSTLLSGSPPYEDVVDVIDGSFLEPVQYPVEEPLIGGWGCAQSEWHAGKLERPPRRSERREWSGCWVHSYSVKGLFQVQTREPLPVTDVMSNVSDLRQRPIPRSSDSVDWLVVDACAFRPVGFIYPQGVTGHPSRAGFHVSLG